MEKTCRRSETGNGSAEDLRRLVPTADGSKTIYHPGFNEHYHSINGALQESRHVFLEAGLQYVIRQGGQKQIDLLEIGFGTGLNFLLSADYCQAKGITLRYLGIEADPLPPALITGTGYQDYISPGIWNSFVPAYGQATDKEIRLSPLIRLQIIPKTWQQFETGKRFDLIYFDAFASGSQPEMWTPETIGRTIRLLNPGGIFVTYAINAALKRNLFALGCLIEKLPGAAGKREMLRATASMA